MLKLIKRNETNWRWKGIKIWKTKKLTEIVEIWKSKRSYSKKNYFGFSFLWTKQRAFGLNFNELQWEDYWFLKELCTPIRKCAEYWNFNLSKQTSLTTISIIKEKEWKKGGVTVKYKKCMVTKEETVWNLKNLLYLAWMAITLTIILLHIHISRTNNICLHFFTHSICTIVTWILSDNREINWLLKRRERLLTEFLCISSSIY